MNEETINIKYFYFNLSYAEFFDDLSDEEVSSVMRCILDFVRGRETHEDGLSSASRIVFKAMKQDISAAMKKYIVKCKNGRKGGLAKAKKNSAARKKSDNSDEITAPSDPKEIKKIVLSEFNQLVPDYENYTLLYRLFSCIESDCMKCGFDYKSYFTKKQLAKIMACYEIGNFENDLHHLFNVDSFMEMVVSYGASTFCNELSELAEELQEDYDYSDRCFTEVYADLEYRGEMLLKLSYEKLKDFYYIAYACNEDWVNKSSIEHKFTPDQLCYIEMVRKEKGYPVFDDEKNPPQETDT